MTLHPLVGHHTERDRVLRALGEERLPQMILITGAQGIGKQRFALWMAQALVCEGTGDRPCGNCRPCRQVLGLGHPDVHWIMPVLRPKASEPEKQVVELAEAIGETIAVRRQNPLYQAPEGLAGHFVATARLLQRQASLTPAAGRRKVFVIGSAERLVPQESSPEAANALLKLLEEPPADSYFLLTTVDPNRLLPTVRSRLVPLRLRRLTDADVAAFLAAQPGLTEPELGRRVALAGGSIGRALALGDEHAKAARAAEELLKAITGGADTRAERTLKQASWSARGDFTAMLDALAEALGEETRAASGMVSRRPLPDALVRGRGVGNLVVAQQRVASARDAAQGNVNPQLLLAALADDLAEML